jgi:outer membrane lipopolysaccharide assembly protein LptE/RlpB
VHSKMVLSLIPLIVFALFSCCTYSFTGITTGIKSIAIPTFENESLKYGLEETFTRAVTDAFIEDNRLKIENEKQADAILHVTIKGFERTPYSYDESENVKEYKISISAHVLLVAKKTEEELYKNAGFSEWATYYPLSEVEEDGIDKVAKKFSDKILQNILESW